MNTFTRFAVLTLFVFVSAFGIAQVTRAEDTTASIQIDAKTMADIQTAAITETNRCVALSTDAQRADCLSGVSARLQTKFKGLRNMGAFQDVLKDNPMVRAKMMEAMKNRDDKDENKDEKSFFGNFSNRFDNVINALQAIETRFSTLAGRIDSRINKIAVDGVNVAAAQKFMVTAHADLGLAQGSIDAAKASFVTESGGSAATSASANNYRTVFTKTIANIKAAKGHLMDAHRDMVQAVASLKTGVKTTNPTNSSANVDVNANVNVR